MVVRSRDLNLRGYLYPLESTPVAIKELIAEESYLIKQIGTLLIKYLQLQLSSSIRQIFSKSGSHKYNLSESPPTCAYDGPGCSVIDHLLVGLRGTGCGLELNDSVLG